MNYSFYELGWLFLVYSVVGWCLGVAAEAVRRKTFVNAGVLNLPVSPVFGFSAVIFSALLSELKTQPVFLFLGGMLITAFLEFVTGMVLEHIFHRKWTDYRTRKLSVGSSFTVPVLIVGGAGAVFVLWVGNPLLLKVLHWIPKTPGHILLFIVLVLLLIDLSGTLAIIWKWRRHIDRVSALTDNMQNLSITFGNAITRAVCRRLEHSYPNIESRKLLAARQEARRAAARKAKTKAVFAEGCSFYKLAWLFLISSLLGDLAETVFCRFSLGSWMSRSSLVYGPFSVVWGMGCVMLTVFLYGHRHDKSLFIFLYGTVAGGAYEYICSVLAELVFGTSFWDYSKLPLNLGGRINLLFCFFWGAAAVLWLKAAYPFLSRQIEQIPVRAGKIITWCLVVLMTADMAVSALALMRYSARQEGKPADTKLEQLIDRELPDTRMEKVYPKAKVVSK